MLTKEQHPSREEWQARQQSAPDAFREILEARRRQDAAAVARRVAQLEAESRELADRLKAFDEAIDRLLREQGGEWFSIYRVPDPEWAHANPFTRNHSFWLAEFDARRHGMHPIRIELYFDQSGGRGWFAGERPFEVILPQATKSVETFSEAIVLASVYFIAPF